jgi:predicted Zn-dependent protease
MSRATAPASRGVRWFGRAALALTVLGMAGFGAWVALRQFRIEGLRREALSDIEHHDLASGLARLEAYLQERSSDPEATFLAARTARRTGDLKKADHLLREAERLGWVENALLLERSLLRVHHGGLRSEEGYLRACVERGHPDGVLILEVLAPAYVRSFDVPAASEALDKWMQLEPSNPMPRVMKAEVLMRLRKRQEVVDLLREAVQLAPDDADIRARYAEALLDSKRPEEAWGHYEWLIRYRGNDRAIRLGVARCKVALGEVDEGRRLLDALLHERLNDPEVLHERGRLELDTGDAATAEEWLRQAVKAAPYDLALSYSMARCLERLGKREEAQKFEERGKRGDEDIRRLAQIMQEVAARPRDPAPRFEAAQILMRNGQEQRAVDWLRTALQVAPDHAPTHQALAEYYERVKDTRLAELHRRLAKEYSTKQPGSGPRHD